MLNKVIENLNLRNMKIYVTKTGCNLINGVQEMIAREHAAILNESQISIPDCKIYFLSNKDINAFTTRIDNEYYIFVYKGVIEEQKAYLSQLNWNFISGKNHREEYINSIIKYGFYFIVFHEYAHIFCGHVDAGLCDNGDKTAQECEADIFSMDYLVKYIFCYNNIDNYTEELEKLFLAVYFILKEMNGNYISEYYNDNLIQNYYDKGNIDKRDHPLTFQRIIYLLEILDIIIVKDKKEALSVKENVLLKLKELKELEEFEKYKKYLETIYESVQNLKISMQDIRTKIPRLNSQH